MVTTHGDIVVPKFFPRNGPNGTYSHFCISLAVIKNGINMTVMKLPDYKVQMKYVKINARTFSSAAVCVVSKFFHHRSSFFIFFISGLLRPRPNENICVIPVTLLSLLFRLKNSLPWRFYFHFSLSTVKVSMLLPYTQCKKNQKKNPYYLPTLTFFSDVTGTIHTILFGPIIQYGFSDCWRKYDCLFTSTSFELWFIVISLAILQYLLICIHKECGMAIDLYTYILMIYLPLQSFINTMPNIWSSALSIGIGSPSFVAGPVKNAISSSMSSNLHLPNDGGWPAIRRHKNIQKRFETK